MSTRAAKLRVWIVPVAIVVVALAAIIAIVLTNLSGSSDTHGQQAPSQSGESSGPPQSAKRVPSEAQLRKLETRDANDPLTLGRIDAPVTMVVFSDYQCKYCALWNHDTFPKLKPYLDSGKLRIEWREANVFGHASERAAVAAYAAALQGKHLEYHQALFANGQPRSQAELTDDGLIRIAESLGLDMDRFRADFTSANTVEQVRRIAHFAQQLQVSSTPTFVIGGVPVFGAQPADVFTSTIDRQLAKAERRSQ